MQEDNPNIMQERGPEIGIGASIQNNFGEFAPRSQEYSGNAGKSPEQRESEAVSKWINKVKDSVQKGEAVAFVHDRTNFDIDPQGKPILRRNDGYQNRMLRGKGLDDNTADAIRNLTGDIEHNQKYEMNRLEGDEAGLPRENDRKSDTLYVSIAHVPDLPITSYSQIKHPAVNIESSVVELRYKQPKGDDAGAGRTGEKRVIMVLPIETAYELQHMIEDGVDPNLLRNNVSAIFTSKEGADWYDSNLLDRMKTRDDTPVLKVKADKPYLAETFLQVTKPGGNERQILADKFIIKPGEHQPNDATPKTPVENKKDDTKHEQFAVSGAKILASKDPNQLTDIDKQWIDKNKNVLQEAVARGDLDPQAAQRLGVEVNLSPASRSANASFRDVVQPIIQLEKAEQNRNLNDQELENLRNLRDQMLRLEIKARKNGYLDDIDKITSGLNNQMSAILNLPDDVRTGRMRSFLQNTLEQANCPLVDIDSVDLRQLNGLPEHVFYREIGNLTRVAQRTLGQEHQQNVFRQVINNTPEQRQALPPREGEMTADTEFKAFLDREGAGLPPKQNQDRFFLNTERLVPSTEKAAVEARITLASAVQFKRNHDNPADYENNADLKNLNKEQLQRLCNIPGVTHSLKEYLFLLETDTRINPEGPSFREAKSTTVVTEYREAVRNVIFQKMWSGQIALSPEWHAKLALMETQEQRQSFIQLQARSAEQTAYNLHQAAMTFESFDSKWEGNRRVRQSGISLSDVVHKRARGAMKPLDGLIDRSTTEERRSKNQGKFGKWARTQLGSIVSKLGEDQYKAIVKTNVVSLRDQEHKWWTTDGETVFVPEAYPVRAVGSMWEEIELGGRKLIDYLRDDPPGQIPWEATDESDPFETYLSRFAAAVKINGYLSGEEGTAITTGVFGGNEGAVTAMSVWYDKLAKPLADLQKKDDKFLTRMIMYAAIGVQEQSRLPKLDWTYQNKKDLQDSIEGKGMRSGRPLPNIFPKGESFWPWDRINKVKRFLLG